MTELYLVDATYELFRAHFAIKGMKGPDGHKTGAVYGLASSLLSLIADREAQWIGCAHDRVITSWRNDEFDGYKTGEDVPDELMRQFPTAERVIEALGIALWPMERYEADDGIATAVERFSGEFDRTIICSPDKDFAQLVAPGIVMWDRRRDIWYDEAAVADKWGVPPGAIPGWLALVGDSADGLPGVPAWGKKSAAVVLSEYGDVASIPDDHETWSVSVRGAARLAENLRDHRDHALLFERLATLSRDADEVPGDVDHLHYAGVDLEAFEDICDELGFGDRLRERARDFAQR